MAQSPQRLVSLSGTPNNREAVGGTSTPGSEVTLLTVVTTGVWKLTRAFLSCTQDGIFRIKDDGNTIGLARTASGKVNAAFDWIPYVEVQSGHTITLTFEAASYTKPVTVDAFLQTLE